MHSASAELIEHATIGRQSSQKKKKMGEVSRIKQVDQAANEVPNTPAPLGIDQEDGIALSG